MPWELWALGGKHQLQPAPSFLRSHGALWPKPADQCSRRPGSKARFQPALARVGLPGEGGMCEPGTHSSEQSAEKSAWYNDTAPTSLPGRQEGGDNFTWLASFIKPELQVSHKEQYNASANRLNRSQLNVAINSLPPHRTEWSLTKWPKSGCNPCPLVGGRI